MNEEFIKINNKTVQLSKPYNAQISELIGREHEMKRILSAWISGGATLPLSPLLLGEAGIGKNRIVYECARMCSKELYIIQGHEDVSAEDLLCTVRFRDDPNKKMDYIVSPLVTAMVRGGLYALLMRLPRSDFGRWRRWPACWMNGAISIPISSVNAYMHILDFALSLQPIQ